MKLIQLRPKGFTVLPGTGGRLVWAFSLSKRASVHQICRLTKLCVTLVVAFIRCSTICATHAQSPDRVFFREKRLASSSANIFAAARVV